MKLSKRKEQRKEMGRRKEGLDLKGRSMNKCQGK